MTPDLGAAVLVMMARRLPLTLRHLFIYLHCLLELGGLQFVERVHLLLHLKRQHQIWSPQ